MTQRLSHMWEMARTGINVFLFEGDTIPINVSGGLKARGHPVGATGVAQVVDVVYQLRHELPKTRQVKNAQNGLTVNFGGFGNNVLAFVLRRVQS